MSSKKLRPLLLSAVVYSFLGILFLYPLSRLLLAAFMRDGSFSLGNFAEIAGNDSNVSALANSLYIGVVVTAISTLVGFTLSWLVVRTNLYLKRALQFFLVMPFFIPPFIMAFAWTRLLGRAGYINAFLQRVLGLDAPPISVFGAFGVILVSVIYTYPYAFIVISKSMESLGAHLEEAAQISGASKLQVVKDIVLPVLLPSVGSAAVIVFVTTVSMFGIPAIMGTPGQFIVTTTRIYGYVGGFRDPHGMGIATGLSMALLGFALVGLLLQNYFTRKQHYTVITGKSAAIEVTDLRGWRLPMTVVVSLFVLVVLAAPVLAIAATSVMRALGLTFSPENLTLSHYLRLLQMPLVSRSLRNSFLLAFAVPTLGVVAAVMLTFLKRKGRMPGRNAVDYIVSLPYAIPGIVIGVAMILAWIRPVLGLQIYNTIWILFLAYIVRFMIFPMRTVSASWKQLDDSLEEAARVSGAREMRALKDVTVPLISTGIVSGWLLAFMPALTELTLSILLYSPGNETIGVTAFNVMQEGLVTVAGAYAIIITLVVVGLNIVLRVFSDRREKRLAPSTAGKGI